MLFESPRFSLYMTFVSSFHRGDTFRKLFSRLREVRSLLPTHVRMMALTTTAARTLQRQVAKTLGMRHPYTISVPPTQPNVMYAVAEFKSVDKSFQPIAERLYLMQMSIGRIIIFCQCYDDCTKLHLFFKLALRDHFTVPNDAPDLSKYRLVDMFTACTELAVKNQRVGRLSM